MPDGSGIKRVSKSEDDYRSKKINKAAFKSKMLHFWYGPANIELEESTTVMSDLEVRRGHRFSFRDAALVTFTGAGGFFAAGSSPEISLAFGVAVAGAIKLVDFAAPEVKR